MKASNCWKSSSLTKFASIFSFPSSTCCDHVIVSQTLIISRKVTSADLEASRMYPWTLLSQQFTAVTEARPAETLGLRSPGAGHGGKWRVVYRRRRLSASRPFPTRATVQATVCALPLNSLRFPAADAHHQEPTY